MRKNLLKMLLVMGCVYDDLGVVGSSAGSAIPDIQTISPGQAIVMLGLNDNKLDTKKIQMQKPLTLTSFLSKNARYIVSSRTQASLGALRAMILQSTSDAVNAALNTNSPSTLSCIPTRTSK